MIRILEIVGGFVLVPFFYSFTLFFPLLNLSKSHFPLSIQAVRSSYKWMAVLSIVYASLQLPATCCHHCSQTLGCVIGISP